MRGNGMRLGLIWTVALVALGQACGCVCTHQKPAVVASTAPHAAVTVTGAVATAGSVPIPESGLTIADAIRMSGGPTPTDESGGETGLLVALSKSGADYYFAIPLVQHGPVGQIYLAPGDHVTVLPWTKTDLFRGLKPTAQVPSTELADPLNYDIKSLYLWSIRATGRQPSVKKQNEILQEKDLNVAAEELIIEFAKHSSYKTPREVVHKAEGTPVTASDIETWAKDKDGLIPIVKAEIAEQAATIQKKKYDIDWDYLRSLYGVTGSDPQPRTINFQLVTEEGVVKLPPQYTRVVFPPNAKTQFPIAVHSAGAGVGAAVRTAIDVKKAFHPNLRELEAHSALGADAVVVLHRDVNGHPAEFILARNWEQSPTALNDVDVTQAQQILRYVLVFDGDVVEITAPNQLPIVASSLVAPMIKSMFSLRAGGRAPLPNPAGIGSSLLPSQLGIGSSVLPGQNGIGGSVLPGLLGNNECQKLPLAGKSH